MTYLTFKKAQIQRLIDETVTATSHHVPYTGEIWGTAVDNTPGLNLVGDRGVYFMSNREDEGNHTNVAEGGSPDAVVYAEECNPDTTDEWYHTKEQTFGGDDGVEFLSLDSIRNWIDNQPGDIVTLGFYGNAIRLITRDAT